MAYIKLGEDALRRIIKESVTRILNEGSYGQDFINVQAEILDTFLDKLTYYASKELKDDADRFYEYCRGKECYVDAQVEVSYDEEVGLGTRYSPIYSISEIKEPVGLKKAINDFPASNDFKEYALKTLDEVINELDVDDFNIDEYKDY